MYSAMKMIFLQKTSTVFRTQRKSFLKYITKNKNYLLINLFEAIDWYPNEYILSAKFNGINEYSKIKLRSHFVNRLSEKFGFKLRFAYIANTRFKKALMVVF